LKTIVIKDGKRMEFSTLKEAAETLGLSYTTIRMARSSANLEQLDTFKARQYTFIVGDRVKEEPEGKKGRSKALMPRVKTYL